MLHLGSIKEYFTWETLLVFLGALMLLNLRFIPGLLFIAGGIWFMLDNHYGEMPQLIKTLYWPAVIMLMGLLFIISSLFKRKNVNN
jgi:hypothetical protein